VSNPNSDSKCDKPIFTGLLYSHYESPIGFGFDLLESDDPIMDDSDNQYYNVDRKA